MGFGSGGGFTPSPNNVPGSTQTGTDKDTDLHQFTGSVDITGSLTLNGASVTGGGGGGGGAVSSYTNSGNNRVITSVNSNTINGEANFTFDGTDLSVSADADITSSLGRTAIGGAGLADAATVSHVDHNTATNFGFRQRANGQTEINAKSDQSITLKLGSVNKATLNSSGFLGVGDNFDPQATLHVSSSTTENLFQVDHTDHEDPPIFVITGSGKIGIGTATPGAVLDVHPDNAAGSNEIKLRGSAAVSHFYTTAGEDTYIRGGTQASHVVLADVRNTDGSSNQKLSIGDAGNTTTAKMHLSSSDTATVMTVTSDSGSILTALESQRVGVGTSAPTARLHVSGAASTTDPLFRIDSANQGPEQTLKPILFVTGSGLVGIGTDTPRTDASSSSSPETNRLHILGEYGADQGQDPVVNSLLMLENDNHVGIQFMFPNGRAGQLTWGTNLDNRKATHYYASDNNRYTWEGRRGDGGSGYGDSRVMTLLAGGDSVNLGKINSGHMITNKASLHISSSTDGTDVGGPVLLRVDHADQPGAQPTLFVTGSGRVGIGTDVPEHTLSVSGSAAFSGAFGSTAVETLTSAGALSVTDGVSIVDVTALANNATYNFTIPNGTFVGQQKIVYGKATAGASGADSNAISLGPSSNIDSGVGNVTGQLILSGTDFGGWQAYPRGGATLLWDGTKWITINYENFMWQ